MIKTDSEISRDFAFLAFLPFKRPLYLNLTLSAQHNLGCSFFSILLVFHSGHSFYLNFDFQIFIGLYNLVNNQHFVKLPKLCQIPPQTFWTESVLVWKGNFTLCCPPCGRWLRPWSPCLLPRQTRSPGRRGWPGTDRTTCDFPHFFTFWSFLVVFSSPPWEALPAAPCVLDECLVSLQAVEAGLEDPGVLVLKGAVVGLYNGVFSVETRRDKQEHTLFNDLRQKLAKRKKMADLKQGLWRKCSFF